MDGLLSFLTLMDRTLWSTTLHLRFDRCRLPEDKLISDKCSFLLHRTLVGGVADFDRFHFRWLQI